ncbi:MAG: isochorismatase family protein [Sporolactobacillus sp.]
MAESLNLDFSKTALVLIDLQKGIVQIPGGSKVVAQAARMVDFFHQKNGFIVFVNVDFTDGKEALRVIRDRPVPAVQRSEGWAEIDPALDVQKSDLRITKRQWGAFFGTELDLQLRRRGIETIVLAGISTNRGVESTAREAFQFGYNQIFIEDAMTAHIPEEHQATVNYVLPNIGRVRTTEQLLSQMAE